jgi:hypothetical protein
MLQLFDCYVLIDLLAYDRQAVCPEFFFRISIPIGQPDQPQELHPCWPVIARNPQRIDPALLINGIKAGSEKQAKGVGEVVERDLSGVVMRLPGPHPFLQITIVQTIAEGGFLGIFHDLA